MLSVLGTRQGGSFENRNKIKLLALRGKILKRVKRTSEKESTESTEASTAATKRTGTRITDITDQYIGKSLIITGTQIPLDGTILQGRSPS
jgi:hypothetical protein